MADRVFTKAFAGNFLGINAESSALEGDADSVARAVNYEWAISNNLRGRTGTQIVSPMPLAGKNIYTHTYARTVNQYVETFGASPSINGTLNTADGATVSQNLVIGTDVWRLDTYNIGITRAAGSATVGWYSYFDPATGKLRFILTQGGVTYLDYDAGALGSTTTFYALLQAIDATANFSVTFSRANMPPFAVINGNQTPVGAAFNDGAVDHAQHSQTSVTVNAGHTFLPGDYIIIPNTFYWGYVIATTGTTITFIYGPQSSGLTTTQINNGTVLGVLGCNYGTNWPVGTLQSSTTTYNIPFSYYRPCGNIGGLMYASTTTSSLPYYLPSVVSLNGAAYMAARNGTTGLPLVKYDGQQVTAAGLPVGGISSVGVAGAGALTGTYRYRALYRRYDAQGNLIESRPSPAVSITLAAQNAAVSYTNLQYKGTAGTRYKYMVNSAYQAEGGVKAAYTGTTLKIDNSAGSVGYLQVGDPICFNDSWNAVAGTYGALRRSIVKSVDGSVTPMTITMETITASTVNDNTPISAGLSVVLLRTTNGGTVWYELAEIANDFMNAGGLYTDSTSDATLASGTIFTDPDIGKEHDPLTDCAFICQHQGGLAAAGAAIQPNTVFFSSADGPEYFPTASNNFDVPSTRVGPITALASDTVDRLAVFKQDSYYDVVGDLDGGQFSINVVSEGDYGVSSPTGIVRANGELIGISPLGFVSIFNGRLDSQKFRIINARIVNQNWTFSGASVCNDSFTRSFVCTIPNTTGAPKVYVLNYSRGYWVAFERQYPGTSTTPTAFTMYGDYLYGLTPSGPCRRMYRFNGDAPTGNDGDCYNDHGNAISYILETQAMNLGEPSVLKSPTRVRLFSIPNDYIIEGWVPFSVLVESAIFPDPSYFGTSYSGVSSTVTFSGINNWYQDVKLPVVKSLVLMLRFTTNAIRTAPFLSGYEIVTPLPYAKEDLIR